MQDKKDFNSTNGSKGKTQEFIQTKIPGQVHVGFVPDKVALGQVFPRVLRFSPVNFIPLLHGKNKKLITFITGLHNKPQGCGASVASAAGPFTTKKKLSGEKAVSDNVVDSKPRNPYSS
jgi:hypothetical protein